MLSVLVLAGCQKGWEEKVSVEIGKNDAELKEVVQNFVMDEETTAEDMITRIEANKVYAEGDFLEYLELLVAYNTRIMKAAEAMKGRYMADCLEYLSETGCENALGDVKTLFSYPAEEVQDTLAHEYGHVVEGKNMCEDLRNPSIILFDGKLISEGFAVWCGAKILENKQRFKQIEKNFVDYLGVSNEYNAGYEFIQWVEQKYGQDKVFEFIEKGCIHDENKKLISIEELQKESNKQILVSPKLGEKISNKKENTN